MDVGFVYTKEHTQELRYAEGALTTNHCLWGALFFDKCNSCTSKSHLAEQLI